MEVNPAAPDAVIIIFGAAVRPDGTPSPTLRHRVEAATQFAARFARPLFIPTGARGRHGDAEAEVMARLLHQAGYPDTLILKEDTGTDSLSSVRAVRRLLQGTQPAAATPIYAATSAYHLPRCVLLLRLAGLPARACPPFIVPPGTRIWLQMFWWLREIPALPYDAMMLVWLRTRGRV